jgi:transposase
MLFAQSFSALGGVTRRGIYDNMKTAVDKVKKGKGRIVNARFAAMCSHYLFNPDFCNLSAQVLSSLERDGEFAGGAQGHLD